MPSSPTPISQSPMHRRRFLHVLASGSLLTLPVGWICRDESDLWVPGDLPLTPSQTEGPFYPIPSIEQQLFNDTDLSRKMPADALAEGQLIQLNGTVMDRKGTPLNQAVVEIWQASADGLYNHPNDSANDPNLDPEFQYWGRFVTSDTGAYSFTSIIPGEYTGRTARHIHFRIDAPGYRRLTTQSYFTHYGERNVQDGLYRRLDTEERALLTVDFGQAEEGPWVGEFDIVMAEA